MYLGEAVTTLSPKTDVGRLTVCVHSGNGKQQDDSETEHGGGCPTRDVECEALYIVDSERRSVSFPSLRYGAVEGI